MKSNSVTYQNCFHVLKIKKKYDSIPPTGVIKIFVLFTRVNVSIISHNFIYIIYIYIVIYIFIYIKTGYRRVKVSTTRIAGYKITRTFYETGINSRYSKNRTRVSKPMRDSTRPAYKAAYFQLHNKRSWKLSRQGLLLKCVRYSDCLLDSTENIVAN